MLPTKQVNSTFLDMTLTTTCCHWKRRYDSMKPLLTLAFLLTMIHTSTAAPSFADFDRRARAGEPLTVVFFGGSLTWGANASDPNGTSYRGLMMDYLRHRYPAAPFRFHDAAIGGTGSQLGLFRLDRDVLVNKPDLVFYDFTANDGLENSDLPPLVSYETNLREMVSRGIPVVQVFFGFRYNFGKNYNLDHVPRRRDHLKLAAAYQTGSGDAFPLIQSQLESGKATLEQLWPFDGSHPDDPGYRLFFEAVRKGFEEAITDNRVCRLPEQPVFGVYAHRIRYRLVDHELPAGWARTKTYRTSFWYDGLSSRWMDDVAMCATGQPLKVEFTGTLVGVFGEADQNSLSCRVNVDDKPVLYQPNPKEPGTAVWPLDLKRFGTGRLMIWRLFASQLPPGKHTLEISPIPSTNGQLRIESICFAGE